MTGGSKEFFFFFFFLLIGLPHYHRVCKLKSKPLKTVLRGIIRLALKVLGEQCLVFRFRG